MQKSIFISLLEFISLLSIQQTTNVTTTMQPNSSAPNKPLLYLESSSRQIYNLTNLVYHYYLACGQHYICDKRTFRFIKPYAHNYEEIKSCPSCKCDKECVQNRNCCPDVMFAFPDPDCIATTLLSSDTGKKAIAKCHEKASDELKTKCEMNYTSAELILTPPVTSKKYTYIFRNRFCAECNGVFDYDSWPLDISCEEFSDFNFLSSYDDIVDLVKEGSCSVKFTTNHTDHTCDVSKFQSQQAEGPTNCNVTGTWDMFDQDIENACNYKKYGKIFCFMCNPPQIEPDPISACNVSGLWSPFDSSLEDSCKRLGYSRNTVPYKNIFCFLCNRNNTSNYSYHDAHVSTQSVLVDRTLYKYAMEVKRFNMDVYKEVLKQHERTHNIRDNGNVHKASWNKTKLLMHHFAFYGRQSYCESELFRGFNFENYTCGCDLSCIFSHYRPLCCIDFLLENQTSCFKNLLFGYPYIAKINTYYAVDKCLGSDMSEVTKARCEKPANDIFSVLPVTYRNIIYKNLDCFICNVRPTSLDDLFTVWKVEMYCESWLNVRMFLTLYNVIQAAKSIECSVVVKPKYELFTSYTDDMSKNYCSFDNVISSCNVSGQWSVYDEDIRIACESSGLFLRRYNNYKNIFCFLCNEQLSASVMPIARQCLQTGYKGRNVKKACEVFPAVPGIPGYKNVFCRMCFNETRFPQLEQKKGLSPPTRPEPSRKLFTFHQSTLYNQPIAKSRAKIHAIDVSHPEIQTTEADAKIYDVKNRKMRKLTCYPGKWFVHGTCRPLLKTTKDLRYSLAFALEGKTKFPSVLLRKVTAYMKREIQDMLGKVTFDSFYIKMNLSCNHEDSSNTSNSIGVQIVLNTMFLIETKVNRLLTEENLVNMTTKQYNIENTVYQAYTSPDAFLLPSLLSTLNFIEQCFVTNIRRKNVKSHKFYRSSFVSELLLCHQVVFDIQEVNLNVHKLELSIVHSSRIFQQGEFLLIDYTARICVSDFKALYTYAKSEISTALWTTVLVCNIISLVCLLLTFITYCLFRAMRSIPGINNMNLIFVMFFAQLLYQFGFTRTSIHPLCVVIGTFIHFFWLSTFACMNVCSFHMYSIFVHNIMASRMSDQGKRILKYMLYSYGVPAVIVLLNIVIVFSTSDDRNVGYGHSVCFLNNPISFYVSFLAPVLIICLSNIYFFIRTAIQLKNRPKVESTREERSQFVIFVKLFSLTGITWILLIIDTLFPITVFSFFVTVATSCQGLFVLVSFVVNKRVLHYYADLCGMKSFGEASSRQKSSAGNTQHSAIVASTSL